jgi:hypothetical protein
MLITAEFMTEFERRLQSANYFIHLAPSTKWRTQSAIRPLYQHLTAEVGRADVAWIPTARDWVREIPEATQIKYAAAIKYLEKSMLGEQSKIFTTLRKRHGRGYLSEKLAKSQQRYTNPLVPEVGAALCFEFAILWLAEQFRIYRSALGPRFPRLKKGNVVGSATARAVTREAAMLPGDNRVAKAAGVGLNLNLTVWGVSFNTFQATYEHNPGIPAFLIAFNAWTHGVAIFRENAQSCLFFDANAGSYRVRNENIQAFLQEYNNVCLRRKWAGYTAVSSANFSGLYTVTRV